MKSENNAVNGLRAISCMMVMAHHAAQGYIPPDGEGGMLRALLLAGSCGVQIFFVLSGFLLAEPFWRRFFEGGSMPSLKVYFLRRWARIAPAYYINLLFCFFMDSRHSDLHAYVLKRLLFGLAFLSGTSLVTFFPTDFNPPLWSIGFEFICYALLAGLALVWFAFAKTRTIAEGLRFWSCSLVFMLALHCIMLLMFDGERGSEGGAVGMIAVAELWWPQYNPFGFFCVFMVGGIFSGVSVWISRSNWCHNQDFFDFSSVMAWSGILILISGIYYYALIGLDSYAASIISMPYSFPLIPLSVCLVLIFSDFNSAISGFFSLYFFKFISKISYGLYLWHVVFLGIYDRAVFIHWGEGLYGAWYRALISYILAVIFATISWYMLEAPMLRWSSRISKRISSSS